MLTGLFSSEKSSMCARARVCVCVLRLCCACRLHVEKNGTHDERRVSATFSGLNSSTMAMAKSRDLASVQTMSDHLDLFLLQWEFGNVYYMVVPRKEMVLFTL